MYDITQFVVYVPVPGCTSTIISKFVMQDFLLKFGLCSLVVLDIGDSFKRVFTSMCDAFHLQYDIVAKRNHKVVTVERFHRFLNKA